MIDGKLIMSTNNQLHYDLLALGKYWESNWIRNAYTIHNLSYTQRNNYHHSKQ